MPSTPSPAVGEGTSGPLLAWSGLIYSTQTPRSSRGKMEPKGLTAFRPDMFTRSREIWGGREACSQGDREEGSVGTSQGEMTPEHPQWALRIGVTRVLKAQGSSSCEDQHRAHFSSLSWPSGGHRTQLVMSSHDAYISWTSGTEQKKKKRGWATGS